MTTLLELDAACLGLAKDTKAPAFKENNFTNPSKEQQRSFCESTRRVRTRHCRQCELEAISPKEDGYGAQAIAGNRLTLRNTVPQQ